MPAAGTISCITSRSFAPSSMPSDVTPVTFPPGRFRLVTNPACTGSPAVVNTIGMVAVDTLAARTEKSPPVAAIIVTERETRSAASAGSRSYWPSAQRYSILTL